MLEFWPRMARIVGKTQKNGTPGMDLFALNSSYAIFEENSNCKFGKFGKLPYANVNLKMKI